MTVTFDDTPGRKVAVLGHYFQTTSNFGNFFHFSVAFGHLLGLMSLLHKKEGPLKLLKTQKVPFIAFGACLGVFLTYCQLVPITP